MTTETEPSGTEAATAATPARAATLATNNAIAWWTELAAARGHRLTHRDGYLSVAGSHRAGLRVNLLRADPDPAEMAEITELVTSWPRASRVVVEDRFSVLDLTDLGLAPTPETVMVRAADTLPDQPKRPLPEVRRVTDPEAALVAERIVIDGLATRRTTRVNSCRGRCSSGRG